MLSRAAKTVAATFLAIACTGCAPHLQEVGRTTTTMAVVARGRDVKPAIEESIKQNAPAASIPTSSAPVVNLPSPPEFEKGWQGFGVAKCSYLAPKNTADFIHEDGSVDVVFHFHAGQMSERDMKSSGVAGVFVSCGYGIGTGGYSRAFEDPARFGHMMKKLFWMVGFRAGRKDIKLRHLALVSWSAGFAAVNRILAVPEWYEKTEVVVLLDSLHAQYTDPNPHTPAQGADHVDVRGLRRFARFATDASEGKKTMVITHSSIVPPDYASTSEATAALLTEIGLSASTPNADDNNNPDSVAGVGSARGMTLSVRADEKNLHVRGFRGTGPQDHFDHLHFVGEALRSWVVPRWYTPAGE